MAFYLLGYTIIVWHIGFVLAVMVDIAASGLRKGIGDLYVEFLRSQVPLVFAFVLAAPILLYDLLKFSNRIAGPLYRCRKMMDEMARGTNVPEFHPRQHDFMTEFFQSFNALVLEWNARVGATAPAVGGEGNGQPAKETPVPGSQPIRV
jgi:hypothetical protein